MAPEAQAWLFDFYQNTLEALMEKARRDGVLGEGCCCVLLLLLSCCLQATVA